ncbi:MAG TPA: hypothetical protein VGC42_22600 [Kofleriaceae bacterium]
MMVPPLDELESCLGPAPARLPDGSGAFRLSSILTSGAASGAANGATIARAPASRLDYIRGSLGSPTCLSVAMFAGCVGLGAAGVVGAAVAVACVIALGIHATSYRAVRRYVDEQARGQALQQREHDRLRRLRPAGVARQQHLYELRLLVDEIEQLDATEAARFELQDLLDHFVDVALAHQRCIDALPLAGASALPSCMPVNDTARSARRRDILQRRITQRDDCLRTMARLGDELEGIDELIRLIAQRAAGAQVHVELDRELDRRLGELDSVDDALQQLA